MRIVVLDGYTLNPGDNSWQPVEALGDVTVFDRTPASLVVERAAEADVVLTNKTPMPAEVLADLPKLRFVSVLATGYNIVDCHAARQLGITVSNVPEYSTSSVAEHVLAMALEFFHHAARLSRLVHDGRWVASQDFSFWEQPLVELNGKRMGIVGFGRIGRRVGQLANVLGMEVLAHDVRHDDAPSYEPFAWRSMEDLFAESDIITLHCPQTEENTGMVNRRLLSKMKSTAILINAARGGLVCSEDLAEALDEGVIAGAAIDVLEDEPPRSDHPLLHAKNCLITPHVAWATVEARRRMMAVTVQNIAAFIEGHPINVVD